MKRCASAGSLGQSSSGPEPAVQGRVPNSKDPWPSHNPFQVSDARGDPFQVSDASLASAIAEIERLKDLLRGERRKSKEESDASHHWRTKFEESHQACSVLRDQNAVLRDERAMLLGKNASLESQNEHRMEIIRRARDSLSCD